MRAAVVVAEERRAVDAVELRQRARLRGSIRRVRTRRLVEAERAAVLRRRCRLRLRRLRGADVAAGAVAGVPRDRCCLRLVRTGAEIS
jgi:hypothetical protein